MVLPQQQLPQTVIIGIVIGVVVAVVLVAVILVAIAIVSCVKTIRKRRRGKDTGSYVEVSVQDEQTFSSTWQPMKVNAKGDYTAVPESFNNEGNNTAL